MTAHEVGIVGCGTMGRTHAGTYAREDRTEVVAAAEMNPETRAAFAEEHGVDTTYEDHAAMLDAEDLDIVSVCTWHSTHARIVIDAAEAGVGGIFCEKPMCTSLGEAEDMLDAAERNDVRLTVGHQRRYNAVHERMRDLVGDGAIGEPQVVNAAKGSGLINWGTHMIDLTRFVLGDPEYAWVMGGVERETDRHERREPIEDRCVGRVAFADGTRLTYESDMPGPAGADTSMQVYGTDGVMHLDLEDELRVVNGDGEATYAPADERPQRNAYLDDLLAWMAGERDDHRCGGAAATETMEIMMALYESARRREVVGAPLETRANPLKAMIEAGDLPVEYPGAYDIRIPYESVRGE